MGEKGSSFIPGNRRETLIVQLFVVPVCKVWPRRAGRMQILWREECFDLLAFTARAAAGSQGLRPASQGRR
jgi:hypothetical protein